MGCFYFAWNNEGQGSGKNIRPLQEVGMHSNTGSLNMVHARVFAVVGRLLYGSSPFKLNRHRELSDSKMVKQKLSCRHRCTNTCISECIIYNLGICLRVNWHFSQTVRIEVERQIFFSIDRFVPCRLK